MDRRAGDRAACRETWRWRASKSAGLRIVARNWRRPEGELDIVADDGGTCVFVEVRSRTGEDRGHALEAITPQKRARVIRAARLYLDAEAPAAAGVPLRRRRGDVLGRRASARRRSHPERVRGRRLGLHAHAALGFAGAARGRIHEIGADAQLPAGEGAHGRRPGAHEPAVAAPVSRVCRVGRSRPPRSPGSIRSSAVHSGPVPSSCAVRVGEQADVAGALERRRRRPSRS